MDYLNFIVNVYTPKDEISVFLRVTREDERLELICFSESVCSNNSVQKMIQVCVGVISVTESLNRTDSLERIIRASSEGSDAMMMMAFRCIRYR